MSSTETAFRFLQLNMEEDRHLQKILPLIQEHDFDVLLLQEITKSTFTRIKQDLGYPYAEFGDMRPSLYSDDISGVSILSKHPGAFAIETFLDIANDNENHRGAYAYRLVSFTPSSCSDMTFLTTHLPVNYPAPVISELQRNAYKGLIELLEKKERFILTGDLNSPRSNENTIYNSLYDQLIEKFQDQLPKNVLTTIDSKLHSVKGLSYTVDAILTSGDIEVKNIGITENISDHMGIHGEVIK